MIQFTQAVRESLNNKNWYAALFIALSLPDICGKIDYPEDGNGDRYKKWFENNLSQYTKGQVSFSAKDVWEFRCSCLHAGKNLELDKRIHFIVPPPNNNQVHMNSLNGVLQMQIDIFCTDVVTSVEKWTKNKNLDSGFLQIYELDSLAPPFIAFK